MNIQHDYSYIGDSMQLANAGYGKLSVHSLHFNRWLTEEQKQQNMLLGKSMTIPEWSRYCDEYALKLIPYFNDVLSLLLEKYDIHQVSEETSSIQHYRNDWDLFYWDNHGWNQKDYFTCFTLTFNDNRTPEENMQLLNEILHLLEDCEISQVYCRVQYTVILDEEKINSTADEVYNKLKGKFFTYRNATGKIKIVDESDGVPEYGFFKKKAYKYYIPIPKASLVLMEL